MTYRLEGRLSLAFEASLSGKTTLHVLAQQPPLKVIRAFDVAHGAALVHLHNISGGVLGGDKLTLAVHVREKASAQITTPGATRIYRRTGDHPPSTQINTVRVEPGGLLEMLPDLLIPFAGASYQQHTQIDLAEDAGMFWWETVAPGREARGELFAYESLALTLAIQACGKPIALEAIRLEPAQRLLLAHLRLERYRYFSTFYICRVGLPTAQWIALEAQLSALAVQLSGDATLWGVSTLVAHGLVVRALSLNSRDVAHGLLAFWQAAKKSLYDLSAIPPRKVY